MQRKFKNNSIVKNLKPALSYTSVRLSEAVRLRIGEEGITAVAPQTIPQLFRECCQRVPNLPALVYKRGSQKPQSNNKNKQLNTWCTITYAEYERKVEKVALILLHLGLSANACICVLAHNCPEWFYVQFGALRIGAVVSGIYVTSSEEAVKYALQCSAASVCVVDDETQLAKVRVVRAQLTNLKAVILLHRTTDINLTEKEGYYLWSSLMRESYDLVLKRKLECVESEVAANQCAMLIFTSGTTGYPKAVMLSHDAIISNIKFCVEAVAHLGSRAGVTVSYLPLNHIAAQLFEVLMPLLNGDCVYFGERDALKGTLTNTLKAAQPTRIFGVPRVFEKIMEQFERAESNSNFIWRLVTAWSRQTLLNSYLRNAEGIQPNPTIKYALAALIMRPYKAQLGLSRCKHYWVGGAPLSVQTKKFFLSMDIPIRDMFGASEAGGAISLTSSYCHLNSTGRVLSGFEIKIDKPNKDGQGEICLRGRCIMIGYLNEAERSRELIEPNGWLHTGDMGRLHDDGCLQLTGRIKELLITSGGENISPVYVENLIKAELRCVSNALLVGDKRKYLTVLLTLKTNMDNICGLPLDSLHTDTVSWLKALGFDYTYLSEVLKIPAFAVNFNYKGACPSLDQKVMLAIEKGLEKANQNALSHAQRVQKFALLPHDFTVATGELGPTLKARRSFICEKYVNIIEKLYCENS